MSSRTLLAFAFLSFVPACSSDSEPQRVQPAAPGTPGAPGRPGAPGTPGAPGVPGAPAAASEDPTVVVTYFGPTGAGPIEENLKRWAAQFEQPDGRSSAETMEHSTRSVNGMSVLDVDVSGTYLGSGMGGDTQKRPGWRMITSVVESDHGPYFAKLLGPEPAVAKWEASFRGFIGSLGPGSPMVFAPQPGWIVENPSSAMRKAQYRLPK